MSLSELFVPAELPYPKAGSQTCQGPVQQPVVASTRTGFLERIFAPAELPYPVGTRQQPGSTSPSTPNSSPAPSTVTVPNGTMQIVRVTIDNPSVISSISEERAEEIGDFIDVAHAVEIESGPIVLAVPSGGFNKVELFFGSLVGDGADGLIALGEPSIREAAVVSGNSVTVTVPWKFAPWLTVPARRLLVELIAVFSKTA